MNMNKKPVWHFTKNSLQMTLEYKICSVIKTAMPGEETGIAIIGEVVGVFNTDGNKVNNIFTALNKKVNEGVKVEFYISQETADMFKENMIIRMFMSKSNVTINIVNDFNGFNMKNKKFSVIVANPPYNGKLHLDIFEKLVDKADKCVFIHPANWLQFPSRVKPKKIMEHVESFEIVNRNKANELFDIQGGDLVISETNIVKPNKNFNWFEYHPFVQNTMVPSKMLENIMNKIITKCPMNTFVCAQKKNPEKYALRTFYGISVQKDGRTTVCDRPVPANYSKACISTIGLHVRFLNFNTDNERFNAWQSYFTKFARFCFLVDETMKYSPYMNDYTQPWTDQRFFDHFELDALEQQFINTVIV